MFGNCETRQIPFLTTRKDQREPDMACTHHHIN